MIAAGRLIVVGVALVGALVVDGQAGGGRSCPPHPARVTGSGLPAPVLIAREGSRCAVLAGRDGRVRPTNPPPRRDALGVTFPLTAPELTVGSRRGRIIIAETERGRVLWRSRHGIRSRAPRSS